MTSTRRRALPASGDEGFTILEIVVAVGVIFVAMVAMAHAATVALIDVGHSRQRQSATGLANRAIEQVRALPAATVQRGLSATDLATMTDPNITTTTVGGVTRYLYDGEELLTHTPVDSTATVPPLVPHRVQTDVGPTSYWVSVYTTLADDGETVRVTAEVSWRDQRIRQGTSGEVEAQTLVSPGVGCAGSLEANPYGAPCPANFVADAFIDEATVTVRARNPTTDGQFESASLTLPLSQSRLSTGQINVVSDKVTTSGATLKLYLQTESSAGRQEREAVATPTTAEYVTASTELQGGLLLTSTKVRVTTAASDTTNTAISTTVARALEGQTCYDVTGTTNQSDHQPCGNATSRQLQSATAELTLPDGTVIPLVTVQEAPLAGTKSRVDRTVVPDGSCALEGCVGARITRSLGDVLIGGDPGGTDWLAQVDDLVEDAQAGAGVTVSPPSAATSGFVRPYAASAVDLSTLVNRTATISPSREYSYNVGDLYNVSMSGSFVAAGASTTDPDCADGAPACGSPGERTSATATSGSALHGSYSVLVTTLDSNNNVVTVADLIVEINVGRAVATATFERAPGGAF